MVVWPPKF
jgi:hypothetical protein